jgi:hypothetical protein
MKKVEDGWWVVSKLFDCMYVKWINNPKERNLYIFVMIG